MELLGLTVKGLTWLPFVIGGVLGTAFVFLMFEAALIFLSSATGAGLIVENVRISPLLSLLLFIGLLIFGVLIQFSQIRIENKSTLLK